MHDQVDRNKFENSDEDQIMQKDVLDYSSVQERNKESKVIPKIRQSLEVQDQLGAYVSGRCSDTGKLISLIFMIVRESLNKSLTENNSEA